MFHLYRCNSVHFGGIWLKFCVVRDYPHKISAKFHQNEQSYTFFTGETCARSQIEVAGRSCTTMLALCLHNIIIVTLSFHATSSHYSHNPLHLLYLFVFSFRVQASDTHSLHFLQIKTPCNDIYSLITTSHLSCT